jgi:hypothetical protein
MQKDHFATQNKALNSLEQLGVELGANPDESNPMNALRSVAKAVSDLSSLEERAKQMGYKSASLALKALSQFKDTRIDLGDLPTVFHKIPKIWLVGRASTRRTPGFLPLTLRVAQREHKQTVPLLLEAWDLADEEARDSMATEYLRTSAEDFKQQLYTFIYENEETTLEDELVDTITTQVAKERFEDWSATNAFKRSRSKRKAG